MNKLLIEQRDVIRQIQRTLENFRKMGQSNFTVSTIRNRQTLLKERWEKCQTLNAAIMAAASAEELEKLPYFRDDEMQSTEDSYLEALDFFAERLDELVPSVSNPNVTVNSSASLVASYDSLTDVQRLHYLKSSVAGEASLILKNISVTEANYKTAWAELLQRYENKRMIVSTNLRAILDLPSMKSEHAAELKRVYDTVNDSIHALKNLGRTVDDDFVVAIVERKLDLNTLQEWNFLLGGSVQLPTYKELSLFLVNRLRALEATQHINELSKRSNRAGTTKSLVSAVDKSKCVLCNENHALYHCTKFKFLSLGKRKELVKKYRCCYNCLGKGHYPRNCLSSRRCIRCQRQHHTPLHEVKENDKSDDEMAESEKADDGLEGKDVGESTSKHALKALISQESDLSLPPVLLATARVTVRSVEGRSSQLRALIDSGSEATFISERAAQILRLARQKIKIRGSADEPIAQLTIFGWIVFGSCALSRRQGHCETEGVSCLQSSIRSPEDSDLRAFWELEEIPEIKVLSEEETQCELYFVSTHSRRSDGRYIVRLPFKRDAVTEFRNSYQIASRSLDRLENRLSKDVKLAEAYHLFLNEYKLLGHMVSVSGLENRDPPAFPVYYMPHHPVLRDTSTTSPLRVVFNASCPTSSGTSLNGQLLTDPKLQSDLPTILLRYKGKQVLPFKLLTVTYGTACAPYLAMRILKQLRFDEGTEFPLAVSVSENSTYVDDVLFGAHNVSEIKKLREQLNSLLELGGFHLRKWTSNSDELLCDIPKSDLLTGFDVPFFDEQTIKALGLAWNPEARLSFLPVQSD
ncbi:PREDICTED: uncharacterized protein LOC105557023 [Vollenhovia emeryi]|uniref:uncharacterized protein LOC105557023 n=1 Tax=Vollenhovia emeryi TaxID=411798 RepID=UPI0005F439D6|nr:PREDICTED: uncharacterized protein LOC105557023 [Vollenhovia emeryi]